MARKLVYIGLLVVTVIVVFLAVRSQDERTVDTRSNIDSPTTSTSMDHSMHNMEYVIKDQKEFLVQMIPHHEEAVKWSEFITERTTDEELKNFTSKVVIDQQKEIDAMKEWYQIWYGAEYQDNNVYMPMMSDLSEYDTNEADAIYITEMIGHHEGAIKMAEQVLTIEDISEEVRTLAENIIENQGQEIEFLKSKLNN